MAFTDKALGISSPSKILDVLNANVRSFLAHDLDPNIVLLMHMDGSDDGTVFSDSSRSGHVITRNGNVVTKTGDKKVGTASAYFPGSDGDRLTAPYSQNWNLGPSNFTISFWFKVSSISAFDIVMHSANGIANSNSNWFVSFNESNQIRCTVFETDTPLTALSTTDVVTDGLWHHYAAIRSSGDLKVAVDGIFGSALDVSGVTVRHLSSSILSIGSLYGGTQAPQMNIDELIVFNGAAYWTEDFTPPVVPF